MGYRSSKPVKTNNKNGNEELKLESVFSHGVRGKYAKACAKRTNIVILDPELAEDLSVFDARKNEPTVAFEDFVKELKRNGKA